MTQSTPPEGYRYAEVIPVRYGDMDTLGHVNNAKYMTYCEQARVAYFRAMQFWDGQQSALGLIIARVTIDFKAPVTLDDGSVTVWTRVSRLGNKSFDVEHILTRERPAGLEVVATAHSVLVCFDYHTDSSVPMPTAWREKLIAYEPSLAE